MIWFGKPRTRGGKGHCGRRRAVAAAGTRGGIGARAACVGVARAKRALWGKNDFSVSSNPGRGGGEFLLFLRLENFFSARGDHEKSHFVSIVVFVLCFGWDATGSSKKKQINRSSQPA